MRRLVTTLLLAGLAGVVAAPAASAAPWSCENVAPDFRPYCYAVTRQDICEIPGMC